MIKMAIRLLLYGLIALLMPLLVHAEELETKEETKIEEKEEISIVKSVNPDDHTESCEDYNIINDKKDNGYLNANGEIANYTGYYVSDYIPINIGKTYHITLNYSSNANYCLYDSNKIKLSCNGYGNSRDITINNINGFYIRYSSNQSNSNLQTTLTGTYCVNMDEQIMIKTQNIEKLLIIGVGILIAIFLTRRN